MYSKLLAMYQKKFLFLALFCLFGYTSVLSQVVAPTPAPTPVPTTTGQTNGTPQGQPPGQGQPQTNQPPGQQGNRTVTLPNGQTVQVPANADPNNPNGQTPTDASQTDPNNPKSNQEQNLKTAEQIENDAKQSALNAANAAKAALRAKIFGYSIFAGGGPTGDVGTGAGSIATPMDYTIGTGDVLNLNIYGYYGLPEQTLPVSRDGFINITRVGQVLVAGKTIEEAQKILLGKFSTFVPGLFGSNGNPPPTKLLLTLGQTRQVNVFVTGEVVAPGSYSMTSLATAFNALYQAGGPNEIGTFREVKVIRGNKVVSTFDIYQFLTDGILEGAIRVQDNDRITVGFFKKHVELTGKIKRPGIFEPKEGETLGDVIRYAGGFTDNAYRALLKVERITATGRKFETVTADQIDGFELMTGDLIDIETVLDRFENVVTISGAVMRPGDFSVDSSPTLLALLKNAQSLREDAFTGRITVSRTRDDQTIDNITLNLADIMNGSAQDLQLQRLDVVTIPSKFDMAEQSSVTISGELNGVAEGTQFSVPFMSNMTIEDLVLKAGGFKESANNREVTVTRRVRNDNPQAADARISEVIKIPMSRDLSLNGSNSNFIMQPFDEVIVRRSPNYQEQKFVYLDGEFLNPGEYGITSKDEKVTDLIERAGGLTDLAYVKGATLIRFTPVSGFETQQTQTALNQISREVRKGAVNVGAGGGSRQEFVGIQLEKILKNPESEDNIIIQEGDILRIPKRLETVQVQGSLLYPTTVKYNENMNFLDYVSQAGGFNRTALRKSAYVIYPNGSVDRTRRFLAFNVYPKVEPGSQIIVPVKGTVPLSTQQVLNQGIQITSALFSLIITVLAFRSIR